MGKNQLHIQLGCDPELFVRRKRGQGVGPFISAHGLVPGTKLDPHKVLNGTVQVDGCALEIGITPADTQEEWFTRVNSVMTTLREMVPEHVVQVVQGVDFNSDYFLTRVPEEAKLLGCEPDWNAWTGDINPRPDMTKEPNYRAAGGHIHCGWLPKNRWKDPFDKNHFEDCRVVAKQLDYALGVPLLAVDKDDRRRKFYGQAGAFRPKPYGLEYRTLSNFWLSFNGLIDYVYYNTQYAFYDLTRGVNYEEKFGDVARTIINEGKRQDITKGLYVTGQAPTYYLKDSRGPQWRDLQI